MWFRRDLRLHDNHALFRALTSGAQVVACYIVDDRIVERPDTGASRFALLLESLDELREALRD
ncbi:MAG TPA: deoxyribodipyrimidine photo-lyase, partial [Candidatus Acidoferrales bacterium]|nr:deoxyribodipyrimidine photo-lyase [Candidatus Acidoferrales bacterium]